MEELYSEIQNDIFVHFYGDDGVQFASSVRSFGLSRRTIHSNDFIWFVHDTTHSVRGKRLINCYSFKTYALRKKL